MKSLRFEPRAGVPGRRLSGTEGSCSNGSPPVHRPRGEGAGELLQSARRRRPGAGLDRACLRGTPHPRRLPRLLQRIRRRFPSRRQGRAQRLPPSGRSREKGRPFWAIPGSLYEQTSPRHSRGLSLCKKTRAVPRKGWPAFCGLRYLSGRAAARLPTDGKREGAGVISPFCLCPFPSLFPAAFRVRQGSPGSGPQRCGGRWLPARAASPADNGRLRPSPRSRPAGRRSP